MRILILNADYPDFLRALYRQTPGLAESPYTRQMEARNASLFGVADFYSRNLRAHGHEALEIHVNNPWLQAAWAREHGVSAPLPAASSALPQRQSQWKARLIAITKSTLRPLARRLRVRGLTLVEQRILAAQIEDFQPHIVLNHDMAYVDNTFLRSVRGSGRKIVGQLAAPLPADRNLDAYDLIISSLPNFVEWFRAHGLRAEYNKLAFEPRALQELGPAPERDIDVSFVGSLSHEHTSRIALLEYVARHVPLKVWGSGIQGLPASSPLHACYQGEAWGREMYNILRRSRITLNHHIDLAEGWANNMRLYEATGMGAMLLTDRKKNLHEIFAPGRHVAVYGSLEECVREIARYLADEPARAAIAAAGQKHAIEVQNYYNRMGEFLEIVSPGSVTRAFVGTSG